MMLSRDKRPRIVVVKPSSGNSIVVLLEKAKKRLHVAGQMRVFKTHFAKVLSDNKTILQKQVVIQSKEPVGFGIILTASSLDFFNFTDTLSAEKE